MEVKQRGSKKTQKQAKRKRKNEHESIRSGGDKSKKIDLEQVHPKRTEAEPVVVQSEGSCIIPSSIIPNRKKPRVTFILDKAPLQMGMVKKAAKILNSDEHAKLLLKQNKNLDDFRPDILHNALLAIFDSPLRKTGMVEAIYVRTVKGVLFEVKPHVRMPRTIKRFNGLMLELLQKSCTKAKDTNEKLLRVIEQPVTRHLSGNSRLIGLSYKSEKLVDLKNYVADFTDDVNLVFVVGAMVHGTIDKLYTDEIISVSDYPLNTTICTGLICDELEELWDIN